MKKILFLLLGALGVALPAGAAEQKIEMVTYFPVPYVAYSHIKPTKQLDVGTATACEMNLGCDESGTVGSFPLYVTNTLNLNKGRMNFNSAAAVYSSVIKMGDGYGAANLDFNQNLRIGTLNNGYTLETDQTTVDVLNLFPDQIKNSFPSCAAVGGTDSISWQALKLNKTTETYLMCGVPKEGEEEEEKGDCSDESYKKNHKAECCPYVSYTDTACYTEKTAYKWKNTSISMSDTFGSDWVVRVCEQKCWNNSKSECLHNANTINGVFSTGPKLKISGSGNDALPFRTLCTNGTAESCTFWEDPYGWTTYWCNEGNVGLTLVGFVGVAQNGQGLICPQPGSSVSPEWRCGQTAYICAEAGKEYVKNGWN